MLASNDAEVTTIQVHMSTLNRLKKYRDPVAHKNWSQPIDELLRTQGEGEIYTDVVAVNGKYTRTTDDEVVLLLGDDPPRWYFVKRGVFKELKLPPLDILPESVRASILKSPEFVTS